MGEDGGEGSWVVGWGWKWSVGEEVEGQFFEGRGGDG